MILRLRSLIAFATRDLFDIRLGLDKRKEEGSGAVNLADGSRSGHVTLTTMWATTVACTSTVDVM
jgi:hypothetical protein